MLQGACQKNNHLSIYPPHSAPALMHTQKGRVLTQTLPLPTPSLAFLTVSSSPPPGQSACPVKHITVHKNPSCENPNLTWIKRENTFWHFPVPGTHGQNRSWGHMLGLMAGGPRTGSMTGASSLSQNDLPSPCPTGQGHPPLLLGKYFHSKSLSCFTDRLEKATHESATWVFCFSRHF